MSIARSGSWRTPEALPRAWIVHEARQVRPVEALELLVEGQVDPRAAALREGPIPPLEPPPDPTSEWATVTDTAPERLQVAVHAATRGLLVLSEPNDSGWRAYVDGRPAPVLVANDLLRAVPLPPGDHLVELRHEPRTLRIGTAISMFTIANLTGPALALAWKRRRRARRVGRLPSGDGVRSGQRGSNS